MRSALLSCCAVLLGLACALPAHAQMLGARPGYANATLKQEHDRQKLQAQQREAQRQADAKAAAEQAAKNK